MTDQPESKHTQKPDAMPDGFYADFNRQSAAYWKEQARVSTDKATELQAQLSAAQAELAAVKASHERLLDALETESEVYKCRKHGGHGFQSDCRICPAIEQAQALSKAGG